MTDAERRAAFEKARSLELKARAALLATTREDVIKLLNEALAEIKSLLATMPTEYESYRLPLLQKQIEHTLNIFVSNSAEVLSQGAAKAWVGGQALATTPLEAAGISIVASLPSLDTRMLMAITNFMTDRIKDVGQVAISKINSQLGLVLIGAQSPGEAISNITTILGEESRERAITITRTSLGSVHAVAAQQRMEQAAKRVPGLCKQWRRSGKIHSRTNHDAIDGQVQPVAQPFTLVTMKDGAALLMMHPHDPTAPASEVINCGCLSIPHMKNWKMLNPDRLPFSQLELQLNPLKRDLNKSTKITEAFDPSQPRDKNGQWRKTGAGSHLPNFQKAIILKRKLIGYSLNVDHPTGGHKARRFKAALGFDASNTHLLEQAIREKLLKSKAVAIPADIHGQRYRVDMELTGPVGTAIVRTAWIIDRGSIIPRLVSVYVWRS